MYKKIDSLKNKNILICITGSIAAYKSCDVIRCLVKEGANVQVMMSESAQRFIGIATISALTKHEVLTGLFPDHPKPGLEHINLAFELDGIVILPATANILAKVASGIADEIISTTLSICEQPTLFVPAMNFKMWQNKAIIDSVKTLKENGKNVMNPDTGYLASLHKGEGRLPQLNNIMNEIRNLFDIHLPFKNKRVLVTAGPTQEPIDPVRYLSNRSSGKMGYAFAKEVRDMGANVTLVSGPVNLEPIPEVELIYVDTTQKMLQAILNKLKNEPLIDYIIMAAAPSDYSLKPTFNEKIKKNSSKLNIKLSATPDIIKTINKKTEAKIIAFALETHNGEKEALKKMKDKDVDFIILNYANEEGAGFESNTNRVTIYSKDGKKVDLEKDRKDRIARKILNHII